MPPRFPRSALLAHQPPNDRLCGCTHTSPCDFTSNGNRRIAFCLLTLRQICFDLSSIGVRLLIMQSGNRYNDYTKRSKRENITRTDRTRACSWFRGSCKRLKGADRDGPAEYGSVRRIRNGGHCRVPGSLQVLFFQGFQTASGGNAASMETATTHCVGAERSPRIADNPP